MWNLKKKTTSWYVETKLKKIFSNFFKKDNAIVKIVDKFVKNKKNLIFFKKFKMDYTVTLIKGIKNEILSSICELNITLAKKQTYVTVVENNYKKKHVTNGIILKQINILEKSRKKDSKVSLLTISTTLNNLRKKPFSKNALIFVKIKKIKPFINKISKLLINDLKTMSRNFFIIIKPSVNFNSNNFNFKKIKSIKRRLRKKYKVLDL